MDAVWEDASGQPYYLAVRTGWLGLGKAHVVPAETAEVNEQSRKIRLPYEADQMKNAPAFDCEADLDDASHRTIRDYFGLRSTGSDPAGRRAHAATTTNEATTMKLKEEEVKVGKREIEYGGIRLRKIVRTEAVNQPVELKREEIVVERTPSRGDAGQNLDFAEEEVYIPLRREEPVIEKNIKATEEIRVGKRTDTERKDITETVRREEVKIENQGGANKSPSSNRR